MKNIFDQIDTRAMKNSGNMETAMDICFLMGKLSDDLKDKGYYIGFDHGQFTLKNNSVVMEDLVITCSDALEAIKEIRR